jgi:hypothetical protein
MKRDKKTKFRTDQKSICQIHFSIEKSPSARIGQIPNRLIQKTSEGLEITKEET